MTGEIPDVRIARVTRDVVHPTVVRLLIAIVLAKNNLLFGSVFVIRDHRDRPIIRQGAKRVEVKRNMHRVPAHGPVPLLRLFYLENSSDSGESLRCS